MCMYDYIFVWLHICMHVRICYLPTRVTLASGGDSDLPTCGPPASFSVHLASSVVTPVGSVHKYIGIPLKACSTSR